MSRKTSAVVGGQTGTKNQYNFLRDEATGASWLLAAGTSTLKVWINPGISYFEGTKVEFAGGLSPVLTAPAASSRIDVISLSSGGTITRTAGTEADTPTAPAVPADHMPICEIYNKAGQVEITDTEENGEGYIYKDTRKYLLLPRISSLTVKGISEEATAAEINAGTQAGATSAQLFVNPKYLKDSEYYTQRPTANEKAALAGVGTPAAGNKYVCEDAAVLDTGNQTIAGIKTFSSIPLLPASNPTTDNQATRKKFVSDLDVANVKLTGNQSVGGIKTFTSIPVLPASDPTADNEAARKLYVDNRTGHTAGEAYRVGAGTQVIAHGLGAIPTRVKFSALGPAAYAGGSIGLFDGTTTSLIRWEGTTYSTSGIYIIMTGRDGDDLYGVVSFDDTNLTLGWTTVGGGSTVNFMWETFLNC